MRRVFRILIALTLAGLVTELSFTVMVAPADHYFNTFVGLTPLTLLLSIPIGGTLYAVLVALRVPLSFPNCAAAGAFLGSLPGMLLCLVYSGPPPSAEEVATYPFIFGLFGAFGGLGFAIFARMLKLW